MIHTSQARFAQQFETDTHVPQVVVVNELEDLEMTLEMVGGDPTCRSTVIYSSASDLPDEVGTRVRQSTGPVAREASI